MTFTPVAFVNDEITSGGIRYGTSTLIVWPRMFSAGRLLAAPLEPATASTVSTAIAATVIARRCNLFIMPPLGRSVGS